MNRSEIGIETVFWPARKTAFTILELLVSMSVLSILVFILAQMMAIVSGTWDSGKAKIDSSSQARIIFELIDRDINSAVLRQDLGSFVDGSGSPALAFYTRFAGQTGERKVSLVQYKLSSPDAVPVLQRFDAGMTYAQSALTYGVIDRLTSLSSTSTLTLSTGTLAFRTQFVRLDGTYGSTFSYDYANPQAVSNTRAIIVSIAILDERSYALAQSSGKLTTLLASLSASTPSQASQTYGQCWNEKFIVGNALSGYPKTIRSGLRIFERCILLPL